MRRARQTAGSARRGGIAAARTGAVLALTALTLASPGCGTSEREVVVTRDQFGTAWPLAVNSARVICSGGDDAVLKVGPQRYALTPAARADGYPDVAAVARGDTEPLRAVCDADVAAQR